MRSRETRLDRRPRGIARRIAWTRLFLHSPEQTSRFYREGSIFSSQTISFGSAGKRRDNFSRAPPVATGISPTSRSDLTRRHVCLEAYRKVTESLETGSNTAREIKDRKEKQKLQSNETLRVAPRGSALSNSRVIRSSSISVSGSARATLRGRNLPATPRVARLKSLVRRQLITRERRERPCGNAGSATARCNNHARP